MNILQKYDRATLTKSEVADELGVSISTINKWITSGEVLPSPIKLGKAKNATVRFRVKDIEELLNQNTKEIVWNLQLLIIKMEIYVKP